jgi:hypothetical protein
VSYAVVQEIAVNERVTHNGAKPQNRRAIRVSILAKTRKGELSKFPA